MQIYMKMRKEHWVIDADREKLTYSEEKPAQLPFCTPQNSREMTCDGTRASELRGG